MIKLFVIRHAQTAANDQHVTLGKLDWSLNPFGIQQAQNLANKISNQKFDLIITSPLKRAQQTAELINQGIKLTLLEDPLLEERDFGEMSGLTWEEFCEQYPELAKSNTRDFQANLPRGETIAQVENRVREFITKLKQSYPDKTILIVTHTGIIRILKRLLLSHSETESRKNDPDNLEIFEFQIN
jgi:broad specificity phosphatase PhoE